MAGVHFFWTVCVAVLCCALSVAEPACSKFHYEEKLLEKMVKVQFEVEHFSKRLHSLEERMDAALADMRKETTTFQQQTRNTLAHATTELQNVQRNVTQYLITAGTDGAKTSMVMFRARNPSNMKPSSGNTVVYNTVEDNLGKGYDTGSGVFTAPVAGIYMFTLNVCTEHNDFIFLSITHNGKTIAGTALKDEKFYHCSMAAQYALMDKGDTVTIVCNDSGSLYDRDDKFWNSFSGVLIHT